MLLTIAGSPISSKPFLDSFRFDDIPAIDVPREPRLRARLARDTVSATYIRRIGSMLGKGARLVRFQDSEKSEWRAMLRRKKHKVRRIPHFTCG
jgi:hypothetical protein